MKQTDDDTELDQAGRFLELQLKDYLSQHRHWKLHLEEVSPRRVAWPSPRTTVVVDATFQLAVDFASSYLMHQLEVDELNDSQFQLVLRVALGATLFALRAGKVRFGGGYLAGLRDIKNRAKDRAVADALASGAPSLKAAFKTAGVSRSAGKRILARKQT